MEDISTLLLTGLLILAAAAVVVGLPVVLTEVLAL